MKAEKQEDGTIHIVLSESDTKNKKTNKSGTGTYKEGAKSSDGADVAKAEKAFHRKKGKMSPEQRKKVAARIASAKQQQGKKGTVPK